jgi:hypothetical protein
LADRLQLDLVLSEKVAVGSRWYPEHCGFQDTLFIDSRIRIGIVGGAVAN